MEMLKFESYFQRSKEGFYFIGPKIVRTYPGSLAFKRNNLL